MNWKVVLAIMTCNVVLMSSSYTMLIPFLPLYLRNELGTPEESLNMWSGAIFAISFAVCAVMAPIWGKMSDSKGKKLMLIRSSALIAVTYFCGALVQTPGQLFMVRVLQGFAAGLWPASLALTSAYTPPNKVGVSMGIMQSALITGNIIGPLFGGLLAESFGIRTSFFIAALALCVITAITVIFIKEPPKVQDGRTRVKVTYSALLRRDGVGILLIAAGLTNMVIMLLQPIMTLYIAELRHSEEHLILISGIVFSLSGIAGAIAAPLWGRKGQAVGFYRTMLAALVASGVLIAAQFIPDTLIPFAVLQFCVGLGFSGIFPSANAMIVNLTSPLERGSAFGMLFSSQQIGGAIGPLIGGLIATWINLSIIFMMSGTILVIIALLVYLKAPASLKVNPQKAAKETPSHDLIDSIKKQAAQDIASGVDLDASRHKNQEPDVPEVTAPDKDAAAGTGSVVAGTIYGFGEEKRYHKVTAPDEK